MSAPFVSAVVIYEIVLTSAHVLPPQLLGATAAIRPAMPKHCAGASGVACSFGVRGGAKQVGGNYSQCMWCNPERMLAACRDTTQGRHNVVKAFKQMTAEQQVRALRRVPQDYQAAFQTLAARSDRCVGLAGEPCCFQESIVGGVAKARQGSNQCVWCDKAALAEACRLESGRKKLLPHLRRLTLAARQKAMNERVPEQHKQFFLDAVAGAPPAGGGRQAPGGEQRPTERSCIRYTAARTRSSTTFSKS